MGVAPPRKFVAGRPTATSPTRARLDACEADPELIALTVACLAPRVCDRPKDARVVAERLAAYLDGVQERLRSAERERAAAQARADEARHTAAAERRARRWLMGLTAAGLLIAGGLGWLLFQRTAVQRDVETALNDATAALEKEDWPAAETFLGRAEARLATWGDADLRQRVERLQADLQAVSRLETIYLDWHAGRRLGQPDYQRMDGQFAGVFQSLDADPGSQSLDAAAERLWTHKEVLPRFALALDQWAWLRHKSLKRPESDWRPLIEVALRVDDDPLRNRLRNLRLAKDWPALKQLTGQMDPAAQSPLSLMLAGMYLGETDDLSATLDFLRKARRRYPGNVLLNIVLAGKLSERIRNEAYHEAVIYLSAALAVRPKSTAILSQLANAYIFSGDFDEGLRLAERLLDLDPSAEGQAEAHDLAGKAWDYKGDHDRAVLELQEAVRLAPNALYYNNLASALSSRGDYKAALAAAREAQRVLPEQSTLSIHELLGMILSRLERWDEAIAEYHQELGRKLTPAHRATVLGRLANTLRRKGDLAGSLQAVREAIACEPDHPHYYQFRGETLRELKRFEEAIDAYQKAIELGPMLASCHSGLALSLLKKGRYREAETHYRLAIFLEPKIADHHYNLGLLLNQTGRYPEAIPVFEEAIRLNGKLADAYSDLGIALRHTDQLDKALQAFHKAIAIHPKKEALYQIGVGNVLLQKHDLDGAEKAFRRSLELEPNNAKALDNLGLVLRSKGQTKEAIAAHDKALKLDLELPIVRRNLALALMDHKRWAEAQKLLTEQIARKPNDAWSYDLLGQVYRQQGQLDEAAQTLQHSIQLAPLFPNPYLDLGFTRQLQGRFTEALAAFQLGHELGMRQPGWKVPSAQWLRQAEKQVECNLLLDAVLRGAWKPADAAERIDFAQVAKLKKRFTAAVRLYEQAFAEQPRLLEDAKHHGYDAACYASRAAGQGEDAAQLDAKERKRLRQQALDWLRADLALHAKQIQAANPAERARVQQTLRYWQKDPDLAGIREEAALAKLPAEERAAFARLWADVAALLTKAESGKHP